MALELKDGYTVPFATDTKVEDERTGRVYYDSLPVVSGLYRPPLWETTQSYIWKINHAASDEEERLTVAKFIVARVAEWDITIDGMVAPISIETVKKIPAPILNMILERVQKWAPGKTQGADAGNSERASA